LSLTASLAAAPSGFFDRLWSMLSALWGEPQTKEGCTADPNGLCNPSPRPQSEAGCTADPSGLCNPQPQIEAGCGADPSGQCNPGS